jgi:hypothetical protein
LWPVPEIHRGFEIREPLLVDVKINSNISKILLNVPMRQL